MLIDQPVYQDLLSAVLRDPNDDLPRLIMADWLDENSFSARAEFIRVQIELANRRNLMCNRCESIIDKRGTGTLRCRGDVCSLRRREYESSKRFIVWEWLGGVGSPWPRVFSNSDWERGFPAKVSMTLEQFIGGGDCRSCGPFAEWLGLTAIDFCQSCSGKGTVPGLVDTIGSRWPIVSVTLTDREPWISESMESMPQRYRLAWWMDQPGAIAEPTSNVPVELLDRMNGGRGIVAYFPTRAAAMTALDHAATDLMRERAGLPAMRWE